MNPPQRWQASLGCSATASTRRIRRWCRRVVWRAYVPWSWMHNIIIHLTVFTTAAKPVQCHDNRTVVLSSSTMMRDRHSLGIGSESTSTSVYRPSYLAFGGSSADSASRSMSAYPV